MSLGFLRLRGDLVVDVIRSEPSLAAVRERTTDRIALERLLCQTFKGRASWSLPGVCEPCRRAVRFEGDWNYSYGETINFRERLVCPHCQLSSRKRLSAHILGTGIQGRSAVGPFYLLEQVTPFYRWAVQALSGPVIGSEYVGIGLESGTTIEGVRHEDALELSFDDHSLGTIVSNDVFEHVPDIDRCLAECRRALRFDGRLYFSIPFRGIDETVQRAVLRDGEVEDLLPPQYHGNPVDPKGSLVFYDYGWDILDRCVAAGFADAYALGCWSLLYGYLGNGLQLMFVAER